MKLAWQEETPQGDPPLFGEVVASEDVSQTQVCEMTDVSKTKSGKSTKKKSKARNDAFGEDTEVSADRSASSTPTNLEAEIRPPADVVLEGLHSAAEPQTVGKEGTAPAWPAATDQDDLLAQKEIEPGTGDRSEAQVRLKTDKKFKALVAWTTLFAVFIDIMGTALVQPVLPALCSYSEGGPYEQIMKKVPKGLPPDMQKLADAEGEKLVKELINPDAFKDPKPPFKFSLAMNMVMAVSQVASAAGSLFFGRMCDFIGCKIPMQICVFFGIFGYLIIYASGKWIHSYWLFAFGMMWNNFFGNTFNVAAVYMPMLYEPGPERETMVGAVLGMGLVGGSIGSLVVMPFVTNPKNGENFFNAIWLAVGLTVLAFIMITVILVPEPKLSAKEKEEKEKAANEPTPKIAANMLILTIIASAFDSGGDEGTRMARGTIASALFPEWSTTERQNYLLLAMLVIVLIALVLLDMMKKCMNLASIATIGCFFTLATQCVLCIEWEAGPYLVLWHCGKLFGFLSTLASGFIIQQVSPQACLGKWNGRNEGLTNLAMGITPLIFAPIYDEIGNVRGQEMLAVTAAISLIATFLYAPLIFMLPKKKKSKEEDEAALKSLEEYEGVDDDEYRGLPLEIMEGLVMKALQDGKVPRQLSWGDYSHDYKFLEKVQENSLKDFTYLKGEFVAMLTCREKMASDMEMMKQFSDQVKFDRDQAQEEMGKWIASYFDDAGYEHWETYSNLYKALLMNAFPPMSELNNKKAALSNLPLGQAEDVMLQFLKIMDMHLGHAKKNRKQVSAGSAQTLAKRR